jgi:hypothetical protein
MHMRFNCEFDSIKSTTAPLTKSVSLTLMQCCVTRLTSDLMKNGIELIGEDVHINGFTGYGRHAELELSKSLSELS